MGNSDRHGRTISEVLEKNGVKDGKSCNGLANQVDIHCFVNTVMNFWVGYKAEFNGQLNNCQLIKTGSSRYS